MMYPHYGALVAIILLQFTKVTEGAVYHKDDCPYKCHCEGTKVNCTDTIPTAVPRYTNEVVIFNPTKETLVPTAFCGVLWPSVKTLTINSFNDNELYLVDNLFSCLNRLEALKIQAEDQPIHMYRHSFVGLDNVSVLDLTGCSRILSERIYNALSEKTVLPKLSRLVLVDVGNSWGIFKWTQNFTNVLGYRNITEINLSSTTVSFHVDDFSPLCDSLTKLNISNDFIIDSDVDDQIPCKSLRIIDVSGTRFPKSKTIPKHFQIANVEIDISRMTERLIYDSATTLYANRLISPDHVISIINCSLTMPDNNSLTEVHLTGYNVPRFDLELKANFLHLDLSFNYMETLGRHVFTNLKRIMKLDLSNNRLSKCNFFNETLGTLFHGNLELEMLNLAHNGLTYLPYKCFTGNRKLRIVDLSNNAFEQITFNIAHLIQLTLLDLRNNKVEYLDNRTMQTLDRMYEVHHLIDTRNENETFVVDLLGNPLKCHCPALLFVEWFVHTPVFNSTRSFYHCEVDGRRVAMSEAAVAEAREDCERPVRRRRIIIICSTIPTISLATAVIVTYILVTRRRKQLASQQFEDTVRLIRDGDTGFQFPVFLSFSSENQAFVLKHILEPLQNNLKSMVGTENDLVIIGDRYFRPGHSLFTEITRCLENCALVVAVMSLHYCKSIYCKLEIEQARIMGKPVIMVFIEDVDETEMSELMKEVFRNFARVKVVADGEGYRSEPDWPIVCHSIIQLI